MSIDFSTLQGLSIPEGVVTQIADGSGVILWSAVRLQEDRAVLTVAKQTNSTSAGGTTYTDESFILLDIYPQRGGTVNVTYGGLTKTIIDDGTSEDPNAQSVFFGTFNGVSDSVTTPDSGTLTIEGNFTAYGIGSYSNKKNITVLCQCISNILEIGSLIKTIPNSAFRQAKELSNVTIPESVSRIEAGAFVNCSNLKNITIPANVTYIGTDAFSGGVTTATCLHTTPPEISEPFGSLADSNCTIEQIIVPVGCSDIFKTADGWSSYADIITEAS